jgi:AsmA protein
MKRAAIVLTFVAAFTALAALAAPWLLSTDIVKQRIASRIEELTGLRTTLKGDPKLSLFPYLEIKLKDVVIANPADKDQAWGDEPFVSMDALKGRVKLLSAILGQPELADFKLIRPRFNLRVTRQGKANWQNKKGALARLLSKHASNDDQSTLDEDVLPTEMPPVKLGNIEIINGIIEYQNDQLGRVAKITSLNMNLAWPDIGSAASFSGSMVWRGEVTSFFGSADEPGSLFNEGASKVKFGIKSTSMLAEFTGLADFSLGPQIVGKTELSSPSVRQFLGWVGYDLLPGSTPGILKVSSGLVATGSSFKFQDLVISLDGNAGTGFIDMTIARKKRVKFEGTLAFGALSFDPYFQALDANKGNGSDPEIAKIGLLNEFNLDLRFSANKASLGDLTMTSMAATAQLRDGKVIIDVGEATLFGGMIQAQLQAREEDGTPRGEIKINMFDVELEKLSRLVSRSSLKIIGKGSATVLLKSKGRNASQLMQRLNGTATISAAEGEIVGLNLAAIVADGNNSVFLDANKVLAKSTSFNKLRLGMHIANGIAHLENTQLEGKQILAKLFGKADLWRRSLAMNGSVLLFKSGTASKDDAENISLNIPFFVGGTLSVPLFIPDLLSPQRKPKLGKN